MARPRRANDVGAAMTQGRAARAAPAAPGRGRLRLRCAFAV
ncbi:conserved hypothetical protein [Burkholderia pseudomallei MSHR346]|nr:conserved hypothetical protein [Burkholderia pseudomallei MSHR346]